MKFTGIIYPVRNFLHQCSYVGMTAFRFIVSLLLILLLRMLLNKIECV
jgi:hypothetical protein